MKQHKETFEVIFFARGGQGAKTASELVAHAAVAEGKFVKAFPFFGPERSGAPTKMFLRISGRPLRTQESISDPDAVVVMDETVLSGQEVTKNLDQHEVLLINSAKSSEEIRKEVPHFKGKIFAIDASALAMQTTGSPNPNMVLVGQLLKISEVVSLESVAQVFRGVFLEKIGQELTEKNIKALEAGYDEL